MKKLFVLGLLMAMSTGCGRGWFPHLFRGAPCRGLCSAQAAPQAEQGCANCTGAGYESYGAGDGLVGGETIGSAPMGATYETVPGIMAPLPSSPLISPRQ